jgi:hypothetical protein
MPARLGNRPLDQGEIAEPAGTLDNEGFRAGPFSGYPTGCKPGASWPVRATYSV